jgi:hypothetical protein
MCPPTVNGSPSPDRRRVQDKRGTFSSYSTGSSRHGNNGADELNIPAQATRLGPATPATVIATVTVGLVGIATAGRDANYCVS